MKNKILKCVTPILMIFLLTSCTVFWSQSNDPTATATNQTKIPNPASVYCEENGNTLKIVSAADGSQTGECVFSDGSTCDEWAYFRGECGPKIQPEPMDIITVEATKNGNDVASLNASGGYMQPGTQEEISDWWGLIKSTPAGSQYDDYFERQDLGGSIFFGIDSQDPEIKAQILSLRDSGQIVHLYGTLFSNVPDFNGSQILVDRIEVE